MREDCCIVLLFLNQTESVRCISNESYLAIFCDRSSLMFFVSLFLKPSLKLSVWGLGRLCSMVMAFPGYRLYYFLFVVCFHWTLPSTNHFDIHLSAGVIRHHVITVPINISTN